jgi:hypothetical protein
VTFGAHGTSKSTDAGSAGVVGQSIAASGDVAGVYGQVASAAGAAGAFDNTAGGDLLRGLANGVELFTVGGDGGVVAASFTGDGSGLTGVVADTATTADHATTADSATTAGHATTADLATTADHATTADSATSTGSASDLACTDCVSAAELEFDPATQAELDAHGTSGDHDGRYVDAAGDSMTGNLDVGADVTAERIGIGTTDPSTLLDVTGGDAVIQGAPDTRLASIHDDSADAIAGFSATGPGGNTALSGGFILAAANGGSKHLSGIADNDPYLAIRSTVQDFHVGHLTPYLTVTGDSGRIGIGTTDPDEALEVAGNVLATGFLGDGSGLTGVAAASADHATTADSATTADHATTADSATTAGSASTAGSAATAAQLAADGADCAAGEAAAGVDAAGAAQGCLDVATQTELDAVDTHSHSGEVVNSYRIQVYGHAGHDPFSINSTDYVQVPGTFAAMNLPFPAAAAGTTRYWRVEASFAVNHDRVITLRLHDPANSDTMWEHSFTGGHASNAWWSWGTTAQFFIAFPDVQQGWKRQFGLEMKSSDTDTAYLGSVWVIAEDVLP